MKRSVCNIVFGGIGGQGILKASEICATAALCEGHHVKKSEVHGMAQRGGSVESHVRFGDAVYSPLVGAGLADFLVCFHKDEHQRLRPFLKPGGTDLTDYLEPAARAITHPRHLNTFLVGALSARLGIGEESWTKAMHAVFDAKILEENLKVFRAGRSVEIQ
ncbi:MAG: indolepyruvate oxidoreductase subunit beta [Phycisphaerae bacterium]|nr:indolepyruvate oxidoreductase subunit beta [Phycisphaerae bacterium]